MNVDDGLEGIRLIRGLGGQTLPAASYALLTNLKKGLFFAIREGSWIFVVCFLHTRGRMFVSDAWPAPATYRGPCCEHCDQRVDRSPLRERPVQNSSHSRWFCRSISVEDSESRIKYLAEFFSGQSWPNICPGIIFFVFFWKVWIFFF